jgi:TfoX/Sxy family transcriptional regulator of competence genes
MATTVDYIEYVFEQVRSAGDIRYKRMFPNSGTGCEYMVYVETSPCSNQGAEDDQS